MLAAPGSPLLHAGALAPALLPSFPDPSTLLLLLLLGLCTLPPSHCPCLQTVETPECMWDGRMASQAAAEVTTLSASIRKQHASGSFNWELPPGYSMRYDKLRGEVYVGGVYVRLFLKNPRYGIRDPKRFIEGLKLTDYRVRILNGGTEAVTRVLIESEDENGERWVTVGVSPNIIDASFQALMDSVVYKLVHAGAPA